MPALIRSSTWKNYWNIFVVENTRYLFQGKDLESYFLTPDEERLLCRQYEHLLRDFCRKFEPPMPPAVQVCMHDGPGFNSPLGQNGNIWRWPISFTLARCKTMQDTNNACEDQNKRCKPMKVFIIFMMMHWLTGTHLMREWKNQDLSGIEHRPLVCRMRIYHWATQDHSGQNVLRSFEKRLFGLNILVMCMFQCSNCSSMRCMFFYPLW